MIFPQPHEVMTTTSMTPLPYALSEEPQARWVDISFWYRTGGIDWSRLRNTVDGVIIRAGQGYYRTMRCSPNTLTRRWLLAFHTTRTGNWTADRTLIRRC